MSSELSFRKFEGRRLVHPDEAAAPCCASCPLQLDILGRRAPVKIRKQGPPGRVYTISRRLRQRGRSFNSAEANGPAGLHINSRFRIAKKSGIFIRQVLV